MLSVILTYLLAFAVGGALCVIAQLLIDLTKLTSARILVLYVVAGVVLGFCGVYGVLVEYAGAGATVPLTGFGYLISEGIKKATDEQGLLGVLSGGWKAASAGIGASLVFGYLACLITKGRPKN